MSRTKLSNPRTSVLASAFTAIEVLRIANAAVKLGTTRSDLIRTAVLYYLDKKGL